MQTLEPGFESFAQQLTAQTAAAGIPQHENAIHHCLALGFQAAYDLEPGNIVFERSLGPGDCDLWLRPWDLAIEVKYFRPIPSGMSRPMPQLYGTLLADFSKLAQMPVASRLGVLVSDTDATRYLARNSFGLLPQTTGASVVIDASRLGQLSATASASAGSKGAWRTLDVSLIWSCDISHLQCFAWEVKPL